MTSPQRSCSFSRSPQLQGRGCHPLSPAGSSHRGDQSCTPFLAALERSPWFNSLSSCCQEISESRRRPPGTPQMLGVTNCCRLLGRNGNLALGTGKVWEGNSSMWCQREPEVVGAAAGMELLRDLQVKLLLHLGTTMEKHKDIHGGSKLSSVRQEMEVAAQKWICPGG